MLGTVIVMELLLEDVILEATIPSMRTYSGEVKPVPLIVTDVPTGPEVGESEEIVGAD